MESNISTNNSKVGYTDAAVKSKINTENVISGSSQVVASLVGQNISVGELSATKVVTNIVSQSISFATGSTIFGDELTDVHQMTGSLALTGSFSFTEIDGGSF